MRFLRSSYVLTSLGFCAKDNRVGVALRNISIMKPRLSSSTDDPKQPLPNLAAPLAVLREADDPKQSLPNLAAHFAVLIDAVQRRITDAESSNVIYDNFIRSSKVKLIEKLKETYSTLYDFYNDPSLPMPDWLSKSPPAKTFFTESMDVRLESSKWQIEQELRAFLEGQGFVIQGLRYVEFAHEFMVTLRLGVAKVPTTGAQEEIGKTLLSLESIRRQFEDF